MSWCQSGRRVVNFCTCWGFQYLWDSSQDMAQNIVRSPGGRARLPCLRFMPKRFSLALVFLFLHFFFSLLSSWNLLFGWSFSTDKRQVEDMGDKLHFSLGPQTHLTLHRLAAWSWPLTWVSSWQDRSSCFCAAFFQRSPQEPSSQAHILISTGSLFQNGLQSWASLHGFPLPCQPAGLKDTWQPTMIFMHRLHTHFSLTLSATRSADFKMWV